MTQDPRIGTDLGSYRLEQFIGRGGMGVVYLASHRHLQRKAAVKVLAPEIAEDATFRERFIRESQLAASIDHPNIIAVYDAGEAGGDLYIAMGLVDGPDLKSVIAQQGPLEAERAVRIVSQVAAALEAAHSKGLIHRDVKPGNILLTGRPDEERAYLTDFGLTKRSSGHSELTRSGQFMGSIGYVAPEQIRSEKVDSRADIYSLGCVLFECLTGAAPFRRDSDPATLFAHVSDPPPRVSARRPELAALDDVRLRAMAKTPEDRFPSAEAFAKEARDATYGSGTQTAGGAGIPSTAAPDSAPDASTIPVPKRRHPQGTPPPRERGPKSMKRRHRPLLIALVVLILVAGAGWGAWIISKSLGEGRGKSKDASSLVALEGRATTTASETLAPEGGPDNPTTYVAQNAVDGEPATAWCVEGGDEEGGRGESLELEFPEHVTVRRVGIIPGYSKQSGGQDRFAQNRRITSVRYSFPSGDEVEAQFDPPEPRLTYTKVGRIEADLIRIEITGVTGFEGGVDSPTNDTCISEVSVLGET